MIYSDKIYGMIMSHAVGDALGAFVEFNQKSEFQPLCNTPFTYYSRMSHRLKSSSIGQITDDHSMALTLLKTLETGYTKENIIKNYIEWANKCTMLGKNTRQLFYGIQPSQRCVETYTRRFLNGNRNSESNGALMRCFPFAIIRNKEKRQQLVTFDCQLTNPSPICVFVNLIYIEILHHLIYDFSVDVINIIQSIPNFDNSYKDYIIDIWNRSQLSNWNTINIHGDNKGWCIFPLYLSFVALKYNGTFMSFMKLVCDMKGDTDTNMAISGVFLGARYGYNYLLTEELFAKNVSYIYNSDWSTSEMFKDCNYTTFFHPQNVNINSFEQIANYT